MENTANKNTGLQKTNTEDTIDLLELFFALLDYWKPILLAMFLCGGLAGLYNHYMIQSIYRANAEIYITNTDTVISLQDVQLSAALTVDYEEIIRSRTVLKKVIRELELDMTHEELGNIITVNNPKDSHCLRIYVETPDPRQSVKIANCLVKFSVDQIYRVAGNDEPTIIDYAESDAVKEIRPSLFKFVATGAMAGAFVVCGFVVLIFLLDTTLKTEEDIEKYMGYTVLASIPEYVDNNIKTVKKPEKREKEMKGKMIIPSIPSLDFRTKEAINMLRCNIQMAGYNVKTVSLTSAKAHEGKSATSFLLAKSLARLNKKVVYLDCDIRNSKIKKRYKIIEKTNGLSEYLCGKMSIEDIIYPTDDRCFDIIFSGKYAPNPSELLSGELFATLVDRLKEQYDYVIVDTPPANLVADGIIVSKVCDITIVVVESGNTNRREAMQLISLLQNAQIKILGIVLNRISFTRNRYGYIKYGYKKYGYGKYGYKDYSSSYEEYAKEIEEDRMEG